MKTPKKGSRDPKPKRPIHLKSRDKAVLQPACPGGRTEKPKPNTPNGTIPADLKGLLTVWVIDRFGTLNGFQLHVFLLPVAKSI